MERYDIRKGCLADLNKKNVCVGQEELLSALRIVDIKSDDKHSEAVQSALNTLSSENTHFKAFVKVDLTRVRLAYTCNPIWSTAYKAQMKAPINHRRSATIGNLYLAWHKALSNSAQHAAIESTMLVLPSERMPPPLKLASQMVRRDGEEPLSVPLVSITQSDTDNTLSSATTSDNNEQNASLSSSSSSSPLPPLGTFLPSCFATNQTCNERTNSCSAHGVCYAKTSQCFTCRCGTTIVRQDGDGKNTKTVQWGGSACERKDVSVPFFLLAGFAVTMTALVAGGIGMLYSMGSEQLPSVIGAGVTGPRAHR